MTVARSMLAAMRLIQNDPNALRELRLDDRLLNDLDVRIEPSLMHDRVAGIARHVKDLQLRPADMKLPNELATVGAGLDDVAQ